MRYGLSNFFGAIAAWLCLAPVAFVRDLASMPSTLTQTSIPIHYIDTDLVGCQDMELKHRGARVSRNQSTRCKSTSAFHT